MCRGNERHIGHVRAVLATRQSFPKLYGIAQPNANDTLHRSHGLGTGRERVANRIDGDVGNPLPIMMQAQTKAMIAVLQFDIDPTLSRPPTQPPPERTCSIVGIGLTHEMRWNENEERMFKW
jgi:hypothetical protein